MRRATRVSVRASVRLRVCPCVSVSRWSRRDETRGDDVRCVEARRGCRWGRFKTKSFNPRVGRRSRARVGSTARRARERDGDDAGEAG